MQLALATSDPHVPAAIKKDAERALRGIEGMRSAKVLIDIHAPPGGAGAGMGTTRIPEVRHVIAVASGKGGVGKSRSEERRVGKEWRSRGSPDDEHEKSEGAT